MISVDVCHSKKVQRDMPPEQISELLKQEKRTLWVDVAEPTEADWKLLAEEFGFHPLAIEDAQKQNQRAKVDTYDDYLFLSLRYWIGFQGPTDDLMQVTDEIDVFLGRNFLVTIHMKDTSPIAEMRARWEKRPERLPDEPAFLLYMLMDSVIDSYFPAMDTLDEEIDALETLIYTSTERQILDITPALRSKKRLLLLRQAVTPMRDVVNHLLRADQPYLSSETRLYYQDVYDHALRLVELIDLHRDILSGAMDALMAQVSNRLNQVMKTLTGISTILMSAALIAGIYGMNFTNMPELKTRNGYYFALGAMAAVAGGLAWYFRRIKWF